MMNKKLKQITQSHGIILRQYVDGETTLEMGGIEITVCRVNKKPITDNWTLYLGGTTINNVIIKIIVSYLKDHEKSIADDENDFGELYYVFEKLCGRKPKGL